MESGSENGSESVWNPYENGSESVCVFGTRGFPAQRSSRRRETPSIWCMATEFRGTGVPEPWVSKSALAAHYAKLRSRSMVLPP